MSGPPRRQVICCVTCHRCTRAIKVTLADVRLAFSGFNVYGARERIYYVVCSHCRASHSLGDGVWLRKLTDQLVSYWKVSRKR